MKINLQGSPNTRDLGGIVTAYGTIKTGKLLRSGELSRLTENDIADLTKIPLQRVVDLRTEVEIDNCPDVKMPNVEYVNIPIIRATTFGITYEKSEGAEIATMLQAGLARMSSRNETPEKHLEILYRKFVADEFSHQGYGKFLKLLANNATDGATLWHCTAGKDRVGTCTALLLHCLGADKKDIFADYILTNEQAREHRNGILQKVAGFVSPHNLKLVETMLSADISYLEAFYTEIERNYGSLDNFVEHCGLTAQDIERLRQNYLN